MFEQIFAGTKAHSVLPEVSIHSWGLIFNPSAIKMVGEKNGKVVVFFDKENMQLGFCFMNASMKGSYAFAQMKNSPCRRIGLKRKIEEIGILRHLKNGENRFELQPYEGEEIPDFEGSDIFKIDFNNAGGK